MIERVDKAGEMSHGKTLTVRRVAMCWRAFTAIAVGLSVPLFLVSGVRAVEKVKFGTGWDAPAYNLVMWAGQDHGFWEKNGLNVEWTTLRGSGLTLRTVVSGALDMGTIRVESAILGLSKGAPAIIVADHLSGDFFDLYVKTDSPLRQSRDLKGRTIAADRIGGAAHISAQFLVKALGLEDQVKYIFVRGMSEKIATLKRGSTDAFASAETAFLDILIDKGEIRRLISVRDYLPKDWIDNVIITSNKFRSGNSQGVRRMIKAWFEAREYSTSNKNWATKRLLSSGRYNEETAKRIAQLHFPEMDKKLNLDALKNVVEFMIQFGQIKREGVPALETLYTLDFVRQQ